jgi:hypothetical protein
VNTEGQQFDPSTDEAGGQDATELVQLADELVDQIAVARRHYADLRAAIDGTEVAVAAAPAAAVQLRDDEEDDDFPPQPAGPARGYHRTPEEEAEIVALGVALNGGSRDEAHTHIVETFGIYDTDEILDRAFGVHYEQVSAPAPRKRFGKLRR